jgi:zeaxanthin glucosyltransferase
MAHFGLICPPTASHVTGLTTIGRTLCERGHRATVFNILDVESLALAEGVGFQPLGVHDHPRGSVRRYAEQLAAASPLTAMKRGLEIAVAEIEMLLRDAPEALRSGGVDALLVDQGEAAGSTLAEALGIPFFTICNATAAEFEPSVPPTFTAWPYSTNRLSKWRNHAVHSLIELVLTPLTRRLNAFRKRKNLRPLSSLEQTFSPYAVISQQTPEFDFPRRSLPKHFHYVGLLHRTGSAGVPFPFERLNRKPMVYCTFGTVLKGTREMFGMLAEACRDLDAQLVISLGGSGDSSDYSDLAGDAVVVNYAPQSAVLERTALTFCHSGNNTVLESLAHGVPVVAVPICNDQPSVAARLVRSGAGEMMRRRELTTASLRSVCGRVLTDHRYRERAHFIRCSIERAGGEKKAAEIIEAGMGQSDRVERRKMEAANTGQRR